MTPHNKTYLNRELSWLDFNERVLGEAFRRDLPPLERFRFLCIAASNFDEFFMVRVAALKRSGDADLLREVSARSREIIAAQYSCLRDEVLPALAESGLELVRPAAYSREQREYLEGYFSTMVFPALTPLRLEGEQGLRLIDSVSLNCAFLLEGDKIAVVQIPQVLRRVVMLSGGKQWALLEDLLPQFGASLFPGLAVKETMLFKVNRDADFSVDERRDEDFIEAMNEALEDREHSVVVRMVYSPPRGLLRGEFAKRLSLTDEDLYELEGPLNLGNLDELCAGLKPWKISPSPAFVPGESVWERIRSGDVLLHLPYESFDPVLRFFREAAADPAVIAIKACLYRTGGAGASAGEDTIPPVVRALEQASLAGKHVTAVVELKARFDEERNISWAARLEKAGVIVVYGLARLKVHGKIAMAVRREDGRLRRYVHLSTGNYNDRTARLYEDLCLFTCREDIAYDAGLVFNMISGYSMVQPTRVLSIAPVSLKRRLLELIDRETKRSSEAYPGMIMAKLNALVDGGIVEALYRASRAGVKIKLCVRGVCTLVPGVEGMSSNIEVISVVGHYLEHSRMYYFANGGAEEVYLASADWMPRNLERRVELMFPVLQDDLRRRAAAILRAYFMDNTHAWQLNSEGKWRRVEPKPGEKEYDVQRGMADEAARAASRPKAARMDFTVRRSAK